ncbi:MAG TPA: hypothetical protein VIX60_04575 [Candidatus Cybelea sp.]
MMVKLLSAVLFAMVGLAPAPASDPLSSLRFLVGTWNCTYQAAKAHVTYKATFSYDMNDNWMRERDSWTGGGGDEGLFTYEPKRHSWTEVVVEGERTATVFRGAGSDPNHVVYRSIYPDSTMTDIFDHKSPTRYTLHFTQNAGGKTVESTDTCVKA